MSASRTNVEREGLEAIAGAPGGEWLSQRWSGPHLIRVDREAYSCIFYTPNREQHLFMDILDLKVFQSQAYIV